MPTPYEVLAAKKPALVERLATNPDLCNVILAFLGRAILLCQVGGYPIEGIEMGQFQIRDVEDGSIELKTHMVFHALPITAASIWPPQSDFAQYTRSKAHGLGMALQKNPRLNTFFQSMCERIESYADHKNLDFGKLKVQKKFIDKDNTLVLQVGKNVLTN